MKTFLVFYHATPKDYEINYCPLSAKTPAESPGFCVYYIDR